MVFSSGFSLLISVLPLTYLSARIPHSRSIRKKFMGGTSSAITGSAIAGIGLEKLPVSSIKLAGTKADWLWRER